MLVAVDTSTQIASLAILSEEQVMEFTWRAGFDHTQELLPNLIFLLQQYRQNIGKSATQPCDLLAEVAGLVVAIGPGSFNGLRVALSTVKGLALARNLPLVGISTLEAQAYQHCASERPIWSLLRAGRDHVAAAIYQRRGRDWITIQPPRLTTIDELCAGVREPVLVCGEIHPHPAREIEGRLGALAMIAPPHASLRRAAFLAVLGRARLERGERDDVARLEPLYLRRPPIMPRKEQG